MFFIPCIWGYLFGFHSFLYHAGVLAGLGAYSIAFPSVPYFHILNLIHMSLFKIMTVHSNQPYSFWNPVLERYIQRPPLNAKNIIGNQRLKERSTKRTPANFPACIYLTTKKSESTPASPNRYFASHHLTSPPIQPPKTNDEKRRPHSRDTHLKARMSTSGHFPTPDPRTHQDGRSQGTKRTAYSRAGPG